MMMSQQCRPAAVFLNRVWHAACTQARFVPCCSMCHPVRVSGRCGNFKMLLSCCMLQLAICNSSVQHVGVETGDNIKGSIKPQKAEGLWPINQM